MSKIKKFVSILGAMAVMSSIAVQNTGLCDTIGFTAASTAYAADEEEKKDFPIPEPEALEVTDYDEWLDGNITLEDDMEVFGNLVLGQKSVTVDDNTVKTEFKGLDLNGHTLTVHGNITHGQGTINTNGGTLNVDGSYSMQKTDVIQDENGKAIGIAFKKCDASLRIEKEESVVSISKDFIAHRSDFGGIDFIDGTLKIGGNFWGDGTAIKPYYHRQGNNKLIFTGSKDLTIYNGYDHGAPLAELEIENSADRKVTCSGYMIRALKLVTDGDLTINQKDLLITMIGISGQNVTIEGDSVLYNGANTAYHSEPLEISDGGSLTINGNLNLQRGRIQVDDGTLNINGDYVMEKSDQESASTGSISTYDENAVINVQGDFITRSIGGSNWSVYLKNGELRVYGTVWSDSGFALSTSDYGGLKGKLVMCGEGDRDIYINTSTDRDGYRGFYFEVLNADKRKIHFNGVFPFYGVVNDRLEIDTDGLTIWKYNAADGNELIINGNVDVKEQISADSGGTLTLNCNLTMPKSSIYVSDGTININGDLTLERTSVDESGETVYENCYSVIYMNDKDARLNISGDFTARTYRSGTSTCFSKGIMSVGGDIYLDTYNLIFASGHKTILNGDKSQKVTVVNDRYKLGTLELTKPMENYTFDPSIEECCAKYIESIYDRGDFNGDGDLTVSDITALQNFLIGGDYTINNGDADLNMDGKINVFDLIILKRELIYN